MAGPLLGINTSTVISDTDHTDTKLNYAVSWEAEAKQARIGWTHICPKEVHTSKLVCLPRVRPFRHQSFIGH